MVQGEQKLSDIFIRPAHAYDASLYYRCRFDVDARIMSGSTEEVTFGDHLLWFLGKINAPLSARYYTIVLSNGTGIGYVRFDSIKGNEWEISIAIVPDPRYRMLGYATEALRAGIEDMRKNIVDPKYSLFILRPFCLDNYISSEKGTPKFMARVYPDNMGAKKVFTRTGFVTEWQENGFDVYKYSPQRRLV